MRCLAVDPGSRAWGWAVYDTVAQTIDYARETFPVHWSFPLRLRHLADRVATLIDQYKPDLLVTEMQNHMRNMTTLRRLNAVVGVVLLTAEEYGIPVDELRIVEVRRLLIPKSLKRSKETMCQCLQECCNGDVQFLRQGTAKAPAFDASDAVGLAIFGASVKSVNAAEGALYGRLPDITLRHQAPSGNQRGRRKRGAEGAAQHSRKAAR
ncbi:MAG: crossover junction endodeoxyribonuclease RuvC [Actinomycetia bacterium]|nr:crossover junction endodeoxyribonuclease RuvC [Actinomycetes bacterium]